MIFDVKDAQKSVKSNDTIVSGWPTMSSTKFFFPIMQIPEGENEITVEIGFWNDVPIGRENEGIDFQKKKNWIKIGVLRGKNQRID